MRPPARENSKPEKLAIFFNNCKKRVLFIHLKFALKKLVVISKLKHNSNRQKWRLIIKALQKRESDL